MKSRDAALKRYYRTIRSYLPCSHKLKNRILDEIQNSVNGYLEDHPDAGISEIEARFGEPKNIAAAYVDDMDTSELLYALRVRRRIITSIVAGIIAALFMWASCLTYAYVQHTARMDGSFEVDIGSITDVTE